MKLKKYLRLDRRRHSRYPTTVDVEFHIWDAINQQPRTGKIQGRLTDISPLGACLQTNQTMIEGHHILLDNDPEGKTPLVLSLPSPPETDDFAVKAQVQWYNKIENGRRYQFDVGLHFVDLSPAERQDLGTYLKSLKDTE